MLDTQRYFLRSACGEDASPPSPTPPEILSGDPATDFRNVRADMLAAYSESGVLEKTGVSLGIAFSDLLLHTWDLARATGQDPTMPAGLAEADYGLIRGRFSDEQRKGIFKPEVPVGKKCIGAGSPPGLYRTRSWLSRCHGIELGQARKGPGITRVWDTGLWPGA